MNRTRWCVVAAVGLSLASLGVMALRASVLGEEVKLPHHPGTWKVSLRVSGQAAENARIVTAALPERPTQHIVRETMADPQFSAKVQEPRDHGGRSVIWTRLSKTPGPFTLNYDCVCTVEGQSATHIEQHRPPSAFPKSAQWTRAEPGIECDDRAIAACSQSLIDGANDLERQARAIYEFVDDQIDNELETGMGHGVVECLRRGSGCGFAKARLLTALCRNARLTTRLVTGISLTRYNSSMLHAWAEVWVGDRWLAMDPTHHHFGKVPRTFLVLGYGDVRPVRGRGVTELDWRITASKMPDAAKLASESTLLYRFFRATSLVTLPPAERHLTEFLVLLPAAALVISLFRIVIGIETFGTFAAALIGLAFRDLRSLPGLAIFVAIVVCGWIMQRMLVRLHLLQVPRTSLLLTVVVGVLLALVVVVNRFGVPATDYIALFPMIIMVGLIERFCTLECEDGAGSSFRVLGGTILVSGVIALLLSLKAVSLHMVRFPETLGILMAAQILLGRYTGYRFMELIRFRDLAASSVARFRGYHDVAA